MTHLSITDYHASLLKLPIKKGVIQTDINGWLQPKEAHYLYECAYESVNILELGPYHGLSTSIMAKAKMESGNKGSITTVDVFEHNIQITKHTFKIKSKNRMIYSFGDGQSLKINPSNYRYRNAPIT